MYMFIIRLEIAYIRIVLLEQKSSSVIQQGAAMQLGQTGIAAAPAFHTERL